MTHAGVFITFEGPEGSGKTTQLRALADFLAGQGYPVRVTREPGGTRLGQDIRALLLERHDLGIVPRAEVLLFLADRAQHVAQVLRPALQNGQVVLCDRYADSTLAYQGYGHGEIPLDELRAAIEFAVQGLWPDRTFLLDLPVEQGFRRLTNPGAKDRLENQALAFHRRVRQGYLALARAEPHRWTVLDATQPWDAVQRALREHTLALLQQRGLRPRPR